MNDLAVYKNDLQMELDHILTWWQKMTPDVEYGGFIGKMDNYNKVHPGFPKGAVLNSRILWTFSAAYRLTQNPGYRSTALRAFDYIKEHFIDRDYGGVYWTVDFLGKPLDTKKQVYAMAFAVYGLSEYYLASGSEQAKEYAIRIYNNIQDHAFDKKWGGYIEALSRNWEPLDDLRLSEKDANEKKSMNTHLHLLEAFANLYRAWKNESLRESVRQLINIFLDYIIDGKSHHLILFFDEEWRPRSTTVSYGHDIEAAWLIQEAIDATGHTALSDEVTKVSVQIADAAANGLDADGGLWYEYDAAEQHLIRQKHSWPQAEAMVGFFNAWQITGNEKYLEQSLQSWKFVKEHLKDKNLGEWYWGVNADYSPMTGQDKVGMWKCPYHNSRACIELIKRIDRGLKEKI